MDRHPPLQIDIEIVEAAFRAWMAERQVKGDRLAGLLGISEGQLSKLISGKRRVDWDTLLACAEHLRVRPDALAIIRPKAVAS